MSSTLESEDLENVQLVRMEDVQPSRERLCSEVEIPLDTEEELETCIVDGLEYDNECVVDGNENEDSNIGSMVSIHSEDVGDIDDGSTEFIVPEIVAKKPPEVPVYKPKKDDSWPTLEILPGGVINHLEKYDDDLTSIYSNSDRESDDNQGLMYACAKCSERFQYLFSLVKHVRWHELEEKKKMEPDLATLCAPSRVFKRNLICIPPHKNVVLKKVTKVTKATKNKIVKVPKKTKS